jgi:hypothetical protein
VANGHVHPIYQYVGHRFITGEIGFNLPEGKKGHDVTALLRDTHALSPVRQRDGPQVDALVDQLLHIQQVTVHPMNIKSATAQIIVARIRVRGANPQSSRVLKRI